MVYEGNYCGYVYSVKNVIDGEVVVLKVLASKLGNSWTLPEEVGYSFLFLSARGATACVTFPHVVEVLVQSAVTCNKLDCYPVLAPLILEG